MYQFDICNNSKNFENFDYLNISVILLFILLLTKTKIIVR
jgi:hypothetical protein